MNIIYMQEVRNRITQYTSLPLFLSKSKHTFNKSQRYLTLSIYFLIGDAKLFKIDSIHTFFPPLFNLLLYIIENSRTGVVFY